MAKQVYGTIRAYDLDERTFRVRLPDTADTEDMRMVLRAMLAKDEIIVTLPDPDDASCLAKATPEER